MPSATAAGDRTESIEGHLGSERICIAHEGAARSLRELELGRIGNLDHARCTCGWVNGIQGNSRIEQNIGHVLDGVVDEVQVFRREFAWIDTREALSNPYQAQSGRALVRNHHPTGHPSRQLPQCQRSSHPHQPVR